MSSSLSTNQNHQLNQIYLNLKYLSNDELSDEDIKNIESSSKTFTDVIVTDLLRYPDTSPELVKQDLRRLVTITKIILTSIEKGFDLTLSQLNETFEKIKSIEKFRDKYPPYVRTNHPKEMLDFYKIQ